MPGAGLFGTTRMQRARPSLRALSSVAASRGVMARVCSSINEVVAIEPMPGGLFTFERRVRLGTRRDIGPCASATATRIARLVNPRILKSPHIGNSAIFKLR